MPFRPLRIATRQSSLALVQAGMIKARLEEHFIGIGEECEISLLPMLTTGDKRKDAQILEIGGKGVFTKEIEEALLDKRADIAMHSLKDVPAFSPPGLMLAGVLPRADCRDALITRGPCTDLDHLPRRAVVGTSSPRRGAQLLRRRPDLTIVPFRGNVQTRLGKVAHGEVEATLLAVAGLQRLGLQDQLCWKLPTDLMLPALGQGTIVMQCRSDDDPVVDVIRQIGCQSSWTRTLAERAVLEEIEGDCHTPLAGLAELDGDRVHIRGLGLRVDGTDAVQAERSGPAADATRLGREVGAELRLAGTRLWH